MRTTLDIDDGVLLELKRLSKHEGKALGAVASELLAPALAQARRRAAAAPTLHWQAASLGLAKVDLDDRDALLQAMDGPSMAGGAE